MTRWLKMVFLALPLVATAWFFGAICRQMEVAHLLLVFSPQQLLQLLLRLLLALGLMAVTSGVVAALFRPLGLACTAFVISGLALMLSWGVSGPSTLLTLLYLLAAMAYAAITQVDLARRISFSTSSVTRGLFSYLVVLLVVAVAGFYSGSARYVRKEGFSIPQKYTSEFSDRLAFRVAAAFPTLIRQQIENGVRGQAEQLLTDELKQVVKPVERYIPITAAAVLFLPLLAIIYVLSWVPSPILWVVFLLLRAAGVAKVASETIEVKRLVLA